MNYPMPDNMGFPIRETVMDMLPDAPLVKPYTRSGNPVAIGLYPHTCHACGTQFEATSQYKYRLSIEGKDCWFCRYNCFSPFEKEARERHKSTALGFKKEHGKDKPLLERAMDHVAKCEKKVAYWQGIRNDERHWKTLPEKKKKNVLNAIRHWKRKLEDAHEELEVLKGNENA